jgi:hypothetical protein
MGRAAPDIPDGMRVLHGRFARWRYNSCTCMTTLSRNRRSDSPNSFEKPEIRFTE